MIDPEQVIEEAVFQIHDAVEKLWDRAKTADAEAAANAISRGATGIHSSLLKFQRMQSKPKCDQSSPSFKK